MAEIRLGKRQKQNTERVPAEVAPKRTALGAGLDAAKAVASVPLSTAATLGSLLSTPSRLLYGSINAATGGEGGFGNLNPIDSTGGVELSHVLGNAGAIAKNDPSRWELLPTIENGKFNPGDFGRGLIDIAGDPLSWITPAGLTKAGLIAKKAGTAAPTTLGQFAKGERAIASFAKPFSLKAGDLGHLGTGPQVAQNLEAIGSKTGLTPAMNWLSKSKPVLAVTSRMSPAVMNMDTAATQAAARPTFEKIGKRQQGAKFAVESAARDLETSAVPLSQKELRTAVDTKNIPKELKPVADLINQIPKQKEAVGIKSGDWTGIPKGFTRISGDRKSAVTRFLDENGNLLHERKNILPGDVKAAAGTAKPIETQGDLFRDAQDSFDAVYFPQELAARNAAKAATKKVPPPDSVAVYQKNPTVQYWPAYMGEGLDAARSGKYKSAKELSTQSPLDQSRSLQLRGQMPTQFLNDVYDAAHEYSKTLPEKLFPELSDRRRAVRRFIEQKFGKQAYDAGYDLTKQFQMQQGEVVRRTKKTFTTPTAQNNSLLQKTAGAIDNNKAGTIAESIADLIVENPTLGKGGLYNNSPLSDALRYLDSNVDQIEKARMAHKVMAGEAIYGMHDIRLPGKRANYVQAAPSVIAPTQLRNWNAATTGDLVQSTPRQALYDAGISGRPTIGNVFDQLNIDRVEADRRIFKRLPKEMQDNINRNALEMSREDAYHQLTRGGRIPTPNDLTQRVRNLLPVNRSKLTNGLELPPEEAASLMKFSDRAPATQKNFFSSLNTMMKASLLAHPATQSRNALSASVSAGLQGAAGPQELLQGIALQRGKVVDDAVLAKHPDILAVHQRQAQYGLDPISDTEALRRLIGSRRSEVQDLPVGQAGRTDKELTANIPGIVETPLMDILTKPLEALRGYKDGKFVGYKNVVNPGAVRGAFGHEETLAGPYMAANMAAQNIEGSVRNGSIIGLMKQGYGLDEAQRMTDAAQVSYNPRSYTDFEKKYLKPYALFYSFASRSGKHVVNELATKPGGRLGQLIRAENRGHSNDESIPESVRSGTAIPLGVSPDGTKNVLSGFGLAHEPTTKMLGSLLGGDLQGVGYDLAGNLNPYLKAPIEQMFGRSIYQRGEPLEALDPTIGRTLSNVGVNLGLRDPEAGPVHYLGTGPFGTAGERFAETALGLSPFSRLGTTVRKLTDTRKGIPEKLLNATLGLNTTAVSPQKQQYTLSKKAEQVAKAAGAKSREDVYFNKAELERLKTSNPALYQQQIQLQAMLNEIKAKRRAPSEKKPQSKKRKITIEKAGKK